MTMLDEALDLARAGWAVFPVAGKVPFPGSHGCLDATRDEAQIRAWWTEHPEAGIAGATGAPSGRVVLDVDAYRPGADEALSDLEAKHGALPRTAEAITGGGGRHLVFRSNGHRLPSVNGKLGPGLDFKADGGYVVLPPSLHPNGRPYSWNLAAHPSEVPEAPLPEWIEHLVTAGAARPATGPDPAATEAIPEGRRNGTLASLAGTMRRRGMREPEIAAALLVVNAERCRPPIPEADVRAVARSVSRYEPVERPVPVEDLAPEEPDWLREELGDDPAPEPAGVLEAPEPEAEEEPLEIPALPEECWRLGFREFRDAYHNSTEAADAFLFGGYLTVAGLVLGREAKLSCGVEVFPNVYLTAVGASGRSRKSTAQAYARKLLARVDEGVEHSLGIGSAEGLLALLAAKDGMPRRVLVDLGETATLLHKGAQDATRGLLPFVTGLYDCPPSARLPNRSADVRAPEPFLCILGSTTADWLRGSLALDDVRGGLAGRFLYIVGREKAPIAFPPPPRLDALEAAERVLLDARKRHATAREYPLDAEALELWRSWYTAERARAYPSPILECLAQRLHLHAWKLALVFAALEATAAVTVEQLGAACAFADYQREAQAHVFIGLGESERSKIEARIRAALAKHGPLAGWEIQQKVRHVDAETLARALRNLARIGVIEERTQGRKRVWALVGGRNA